MSAFSPTSQIVAVPVSLLGQLPEALAEYGAELPLKPADAASPRIVTLLGHLDREGSEDLRAGDLGVSVVGQTLTDGRMAFSGHWSTAFLAAIGIDARLDGVGILTQEQYQAAMPQGEDEL
jgi:hypothetical protein